MSDNIFITGCYIVRDEESSLAASLVALKPFVDDVVVYDTGSVDDTVRLAEALGARVVRGYWDDDFGAARNRALEHCFGDWILTVDADEVIQGDPTKFRVNLAAATADVLTVDQVSEHGESGSANFHVRPTRVFRRARCHWEGPVHEQVVGIRDDAVVRREHLGAIWLVHSGYTQGPAVLASKGERNLRVARASLAKLEDQQSAQASRLRSALIRSAAASGDHDLAVGELRLLSVGKVSAGELVLLAHVAVDLFLGVEEWDSALEWIGRLDDLGESRAVCLALRARLANRLGQWSEAERCAVAAAAFDRDPFKIKAAEYQDELIESLIRQARLLEAAEVAVASVAAGRTNLDPAVIVALVNAAPEQLDQLVLRLPEEACQRFIAALSARPAALSAPLFEGMWAAGRMRHALLAAAALQTASLDWSAVVTWSLRFRANGMSPRPLELALLDGDRDLHTRIMCGALLVESGFNERLSDLEPLLALVDDADVPVLIPRLQEVAPRLAATLTHA